MMPVAAPETPPQEADTRKIRVFVETISRLLRRNAEPAIRKILAKAHPADITGLLEEINPEQVVQIFALITSRATAASVLVEISESRCHLLLDNLDPARLATIIKEARPDELTDFLAKLPEKQAQRIHEMLGIQERDEVAALSQYDPDSAGGLMTSDVFAMEKCVPVAMAIQELHSQAHVEMVFYLYVTDEDGRLMGVVSLRELLLARPTAQLGDVMRTRAVTVSPSTSAEEIARLTDRYRLLAIPVVDSSGMLLGMVTVDDVLEIIADQATQDMFRMAGTDSEETQVQSPFRIFRFRVPWLMAAFVGGIGAAGVVEHFEATLSQVIQLSAFLPIVMGMAGNVGTQAATVTVRGLAVGAIKGKGGFIPLLMKEMSVGLLLGVFYGICLAATSWFMFHSVLLVQTVGLSIFINITAAALIATSLPLFFHRIGSDPALAAGPFVLTAVDVLGVANYMLIASLIYGL